MEYIVTISFKEGDLIYKLTADDEAAAKQQVIELHQDNLKGLQSVTAELYTNQRYDHDLDQIGEFDEGIPFNQEWHGEYTLYGVKQQVTIQGIEPDDTGKNNYYVAVFNNGSTKDIIRKDGTWQEREAGVTEEAIQIGKLIQQHFS